MIEVVTVSVRPTEDVDFFQVSFDFYDYQTIHYGDKRLYVEKKISEDNLSLTVTNIWTSIEDYEEYLKDPELIKVVDLLREHNIKFKIKTEKTIKSLDI